MDNVFEEAVAASTTTADQTSLDSNVSTDNTGSELGSEFDLSMEDLYTDDELEDLDSDTEEETVEQTDVTNLEPTNNAFAQMRTQNKEYSQKINELDAIAKAAGLKDVDELIAKSKEAQIKKQAKNQGIPEEVARELAEFREFRAKMEQKDIENARIAKENTLAQNVNEFVQKNSITNEGLKKISDALVKDGITNETLMELPKSALNKILGSYIDINVQQTLARKEAIKNELPLDQSSKVEMDALNKEIDALAKQLAGKI